jgi:hypothetical protein
MSIHDPILIDSIKKFSLNFLSKRIVLNSIFFYFSKYFSNCFYIDRSFLMIILKINK